MNQTINMMTFFSFYLLFCDACVGIFYLNTNVVGAAYSFFVQ